MTRTAGGPQAAIPELDPARVVYVIEEIGVRPEVVEPLSRELLAHIQTYRAVNPTTTIRVTLFRNVTKRLGRVLTDLVASMDDPKTAAVLRVALMTWKNTRRVRVGEFLRDAIALKAEVEGAAAWARGAVPATADERQRWRSRNRTDRHRALLLNRSLASALRHGVPLGKLKKGAAAKLLRVVMAEAGPACFTPSEGRPFRALVAKHLAEAHRLYRDRLEIERPYRARH